MLNVSFSIEDSTQVGEVRRAAAAHAMELNLDEITVGKVSIVASELSTNILKHAKSGRVLLRSDAAQGFVEILALDKGPGIPDIARSLHDGYSTAGTAGNGLGAVQRLSHTFEIFSNKDAGTAVLSRIFAAPAEGKPSPSGLLCGAVCYPIRTEKECGDLWAIKQAGDEICVMVADGLGHGPEAARASALAGEIFRAISSLRPSEILNKMHVALKATRGAAVSIATLDTKKRSLQFSGIGNVSGLSLHPRDLKAQHFVCLGGTIGHAARKIQEFAYDWPEGSLLFLHSDGIMTRWRLDAYPGLAARDPALIAGIIVRDFARSTDDVTLLVVKA